MSDTTENTVKTKAGLAAALSLRALVQRLPVTSLLSIVDQVLVSGTNFLTTVIIGRAAGQDALGAYSLAFSVMLLVLCIQESLVCLPYVIEHRSLDGDERRRFAGSIALQASGLASLVLIFVLIGAAIISLTGDQTTAQLALAFAVAMPFALFRDFARRISFAQLAVRGAILVDGVVLLSQLCLLLVLWRFGWLTVAGSYLAIGAACAIGGAFWWYGFRSDFRTPNRNLLADVRRGWDVGRWVFGSQIISVLSSYLIYWLVANRLGQSASGVLAACSSVILLANPIILGTYMCFPPRCAQALAEEGDGALYRVALRTAAFLAATLALFSMAAFFLGDIFLTTIYGDEFSGFAAICGLYGLSAMTTALSSVPDQALWIKRRPQIGFWTGVLGLFCMTMAAVWLMPIAGLEGAMWAVTLGSALTAAGRWVALARICRPENGAIVIAPGKIETLSTRESPA